MKTTRLHIDEKGKPKKKKLKYMVKKFLGMNKKDKQKIETQASEDSNQKVASVNEWISSDYTSADDMDDNTDDTAQISSSTESEILNRDSDTYPALSSKLLASNDEKKKKTIKSLTFAKNIADIHVFERDLSSCDDSDVGDDDRKQWVLESLAAKEALSKESKDIKNLEDCSYKDLQKRAKELQIPANTKKITMIHAIRAREAELLNEKKTSECKSTPSITTTDELKNNHNNCNEQRKEQKLSQKRVPLSVVIENGRGQVLECNKHLDTDNTDACDKDNDCIENDTETDNDMDVDISLMEVGSIDGDNEENGEYSMTWHECGNDDDDDDVHSEVNNDSNNDGNHDSNNEGNNDVNDIVVVKTEHDIKETDDTVTPELVTPESITEDTTTEDTVTQDSTVEEIIVDDQVVSGTVTDDVIVCEDSIVEDSIFEPSTLDDTIIDDTTVAPTPNNNHLLHSMLCDSDDNSNDNNNANGDDKFEDKTVVYVDENVSSTSIEIDKNQNERKSNHVSTDSEIQDHSNIPKQEEEVVISQEVTPSVDTKNDESHQELEKEQEQDDVIEYKGDVKELMQALESKVNHGDDDMIDDDVNATDDSLIAMLVDDFNKKEVIKEPETIVEDTESVVEEVEDSLIVALVQDFDSKRPSIEGTDDGKNKNRKEETTTKKQEVLENQSIAKDSSVTITSENEQVNPNNTEVKQTELNSALWRNRESFNEDDVKKDCDGDSSTDLQELLGLVDNDNEDEDDDDDAGLTDAIEGFLIEHHSDKVSVEKSNSQPKIKNDNSQKTSTTDAHSDGDIIRRSESADEKDEEKNEEHDHFEESSVSLSVANSQAFSNNQFRMDTSDESSDGTMTTTGTSGPRILRASRSSKFSSDSVMGDIILDDNNLEEDSDIVPRHRRRGRGEDDTTVQLHDESTVAMPEDDSTLPLPEEDILAVLKDEYDRSPAKFKVDDHHDNLELQHGQNAHQLDVFNSHVKQSPPLHSPSNSSPRSKSRSSYDPPASTGNHFQFLDMSASLSTDAMRSDLLALQTRLLRISPAGLHTSLTVPLSKKVLSRHDSFSSQDETGDYFNSNVPLTRMRPGLRKVDSTKTFDTDVSSLGSSDAVDQKRQQILKKHADEKRRQQKQQEEHLAQQREARQAARALLKSSSTEAIDQALAGRRGHHPMSKGVGKFPVPAVVSGPILTPQSSHRDNHHHHHHEPDAIHLADHFVYTSATSTPMTTPTSSNHMSGQLNNHSASRGTMQQRSDSYNHAHQQNHPSTSAHVPRTSSFNSYQPDTSELRNATSNTIIDTFKSRTQKQASAALTAKNIRLNSKQNAAYGTSNGKKSSPNHHSTHTRPPIAQKDSHVSRTGSSAHLNGGSSGAATSGGAATAVIDIYKPLPPEQTISPKIKRKTYNHLTRGHSNNSSLVSDNDSCSLYQPSIVTANPDDETSSRGSSGRESHPSNKHATHHHSHHHYHHHTHTPNSTAASRMRAAAIKDRVASSSSMTSSSPSESSRHGHHPFHSSSSTNTHKAGAHRSTLTTRTSSGSTTSHKASSPSELQSATKTPAQSHPTEQSTPTVDLETKTQSVMSVRSQSPALNKTSSQTPSSIPVPVSSSTNSNSSTNANRHSAHNSRIPVGPQHPSSSKPVHEESHTKPTPQSVSTSEPIPSTSIPESTTVPEVIPVTSTPTSIKPSTPMTSTTPTVQDTPPVTDSVATAGKASVPTTGTGSGTGPSPLVLRARALVASRHERNSGLKAKSTQSSTPKTTTVTPKDDEVDDKTSDISPIREAQNPFLAII